LFLTALVTQRLTSAYYLVFLVKGVLLALQGPQEPFQRLLVQLVLKVLPALKALQVLRELQEMLVLKELQVKLVLKEMTALRVHRALKVYKVFQVK
jgi:hypothetical protein